MVLTGKQRANHASRTTFGVFLDMPPCQATFLVSDPLNASMLVRSDVKFFDDVPRYPRLLAKKASPEMQQGTRASVDAIATSTQLYPLLFNTNSDSKLRSYSNVKNTFTYSYSYSYLRNTWTKLLSHKSKVKTTPEKNRTYTHCVRKSHDQKPKV